jgi:beta-glucosidase
VVLLKNRDVPGTGSPLLPADPARLHSVVIVGNLAGTVPLGGYSGDPSTRVSAVQGITAAVRAASPGASVTYDSCGTSTTAATPARCSPQTMKRIRHASLVVVFVGTDGKVASEGHDRSGLAMPGNYDSLIGKVAGAGNPRMVLAIQSDGPVDISQSQQKFPAVVFSGYNGESQGTALAAALFGRQDPAGHLDFTWYKDDSQLPAMQNYGLTPGQTGGKGRTYMYFTGTPTYPFGYGLSYARFRCSDFHAGPAPVTANGSVRVGFDVTNTGRTRGATVAQLYAATEFTVPGVQLPARRLVGFRRTAVLVPGQTQHITLTVRAAALSFWNEQRLRQVVYDGPYQFGVGYNASGIEAVNNDQSFVDLAHARVRYASGNPRVVRISPAGVLTAAGPGTTTISVTVNGVTGSAPVVVR